MTPADIAHAALVEIGRPDLAELVHWYDEDGGYLEYADDELTRPNDEALMAQAESLARASIGNAPMVRL